MEMRKLTDRLQRGWQYMKVKTGSAYHAVKKRFARTRFGDNECLAVNIAPLHTDLCEKKDLSSFIFYASSALFHQNIREARWASYHILNYMRAPLLTDWPVPKGQDQLVQDLLFHRLSLQWAQYYQEQGDLVRAVNWYQLITARYPEYHKTACYELGNIALICATELQQGVLTGEVSEQEAIQYQEKAQDYLTKAALLGENDAQRLLDRLFNKPPAKIISLPHAARISSLYEKLEAILQSNHQTLTTYFLSLERNSMRTEKQPESNLTRELSHQSVLVSEPIKIAKQEFNENAQQTLSCSFDCVQNLFDDMKETEIKNESVFIKRLKREIAAYEEHIERIKDVTAQKYGADLYQSIKDLLNQLKPTIETAVKDKDDKPVLVKLKALEALNKNIGCYYHFLGIYSDPLSIKKFRKNLKGIEAMAIKNPLACYQSADKNRLTDIDNRKQEAKKIVEDHHKKLIEHHEGAESLLVTHIENLHQTIVRVENKLIDFENGEEYQRLRELPTILEQQLRLQEESSNELKKQVKTQEEDKAKLEQQMKAQVKIQKEDKAKLEKQIETINQRLGLYQVYDEKPHSIRCPISGSRMRDPVIAEDGHTYERIYIQEWLRNHDTSPLTGLKIGRTLTSNYTMKKLIDEYLEKHQKVRGNQGFFAQSSSSTTSSGQCASTDNHNAESPRIH
ncbi:MAG: hypothetical protein K0S11_23 [Gammaproteobacteria bacterium]|jgi:hypothetical protein|nr:hypothetical protein [Gammaproteobacteria bacterium]